MSYLLFTHRVLGASNHRLRRPTTIQSFTVFPLLCVSALFCVSRAFVTQSNTSRGIQNNLPAARSAARSFSSLQAAAAASAGSSKMDSPRVDGHQLSIATYNIWFGQTGHEEERMEGIVENLAPHAPHLIGLQEVTPHLARLLCPRLESLNYHVILQPFGSYVCGIALKVDHIISSGFYPFPNSRMDRGIVWALVHQNGREILFTTTHLESFLSKEENGGTEREIQLVEMMEFCNRCMRERSTVDLAVITGDLNWDDERPRSIGDNQKLMSLMDSSVWIDAYREVEPTARGYTYDPVENPMLGGGSVRRRLDRILVRKRLGKVQVDMVEMVGKDAIPDLSYMTPPSRFRKPQQRLVAPSDHFGLVTKLDF